MNKILQKGGRYRSERNPNVAAGWTLERLTPVSHLHAANGMRAGPDGRIYIAQVSGSQISALDLSTGEIEVISPMGGEIIGPDDLDFDARGNLYATEFQDARVSVRDKNGNTRILRDDVPGANGITFYKDRLFIDECRMGGRLMELDLNGGAPKVLAENLVLPNALAPGPDEKLYFPSVGANEIWRIDPNGGPTERVVTGLHHPVAVKFDSKGFIVTPQSQSGEVLRINPQTGASTVLAQLDPGIDNLAFVGERLFVSYLTNGRVVEVLADSKSRDALPGGLQRPMDLAFGDDGNLYVADNVAFYALPPGGKLNCIGRFFGQGYPNGVRGLDPLGNGAFAVTTTNGRVVVYRPWAKEFDVIIEGLNQPYGIAASRGAFIVAEYGAGRVVAVKSGQKDELASGLRHPIDVFVTSDGTCLVSESDGGRVAKVKNGSVETVLDGLQRPHGILVHQGMLYVLDAGAKQLVAYDMASKTRSIIASDLPVGAPPGIVPKPLRGIPPLAPPMNPFAGLTVGSKGELYIAADGEGSVMSLRRDA